MGGCIFFLLQLDRNTHARLGDEILSWLGDGEAKVVVAFLIETLNVSDCVKVLIQAFNCAINPILYRIIYTVYIHVRISGDAILG